MMKLCPPLAIAIFACAIATTAFASADQKNKQQLLRLPYKSVVDDLERDYFLYLPIGYDEDPSAKWPVLIYLHGDGERGNGKEDLDFVLGYGPLYEAWIQKRDLPFIIIAPQNHMFGRDGPDGPDYIRNRTRDGIPRRLEEGVPPHNTDMPARMMYGPMRGAVPAEDTPSERFQTETGWRKTDPDVISILDSVLENYRADKDRVYLSGASMGGFGTWYYASEYPERFAALLPVVGYPSVEQAEAVAKAGIPVWVFSGGRDPAVETKYFFAGMNRMDELDANIRFTTEQDMFHDVWNRVYAGDDVYNWLLKHKKR
ncbi:MAG TPA: alpha/beta hydrolase-fold protein [Pontiella sp.]|nr:alpha/beta hydrolase-fold protein [Pontiella sp.]